jgi:hypothetical protein
MVVTGDNVWASRIRASRASTPSARHAEQASAPPASRNRLYRVTRQLINKEHFDHGEVRGPICQAADRSTKMGRHFPKKMPPASHQPCSSST